MTLPEPAQQIPSQGQQKETTMVPAAPAPTVPEVEDAGQFVSPTVPEEVAHVVTPITNTPPVAMPQGVSHVGEGTPSQASQEIPTQTAVPKNVIPFSLTGWRLAKDVRSWRYYDAEKRKKMRKEQAKMPKAA